MHVIVVGGGIVGLFTAYYLRKTGCKVTVVDSQEITNGCSFGNMGYISPSHFIPIATPGIVAQGLKWMLSSSSPFYIRPRINMDLLRWGWMFRKQAKADIVKRNAPHLNDLLQLSRRLMDEVRTELPDDFGMITKGCWMLYKNEKTGDHEKHLAEMAEGFGLNTRICNRHEVQEHETETEVDVAGGVLYTDDCHLDSTRLMAVLYKQLIRSGVSFWINTKVQDIITGSHRIRKIVTDRGEMTCDELVIANGSWMGMMAKNLGIRLLIQPGKGYSVDYNDLEKNLQYPSILVDHRTATTPLGNRLRIGGTMELSGHNDKILPRRVAAIYEAFKLYYPKMNIPAPDPGKAWFGYRPVTPDGLPYIGRHQRYSNLCFAGGHAMLGVSAAAATGKLIREIIGGEKTTIDVSAFNPARFG